MDYKKFVAEKGSDLFVRKLFSIAGTESDEAWYRVGLNAIELFGEQIDTFGDFISSRGEQWKRDLVNVVLEISRVERMAEKIRLQPDFTEQQLDILSHKKHSLELKRERIIAHSDLLPEMKKSIADLADGFRNFLNNLSEYLNMLVIISKWTVSRMDSDIVVGRLFGRPCTVAEVLDGAYGKLLELLNQHLTGLAYDVLYECSKFKSHYRLDEIWKLILGKDKKNVKYQYLWYIEKMINSVEPIRQRLRIESEKSKKETA